MSRCYATGVAMATILCPTRRGVLSMLASKYEFDTTTQYWVIAIITRIRYVTLWPWPYVMPLWWSILVPSLNWIRVTVPEVGQLQFSFDRQLKIPIFTFFWSKGGQISTFIFLTPKGTFLARTTYNDVLRVGVCPEMRPVAVAKWPKKDRNFYASNWLFAQTTHVDVSPWNFASGK